MKHLIGSITWFGAAVAITGITLLGAAPWNGTATPLFPAGITLTVAGIVLTCLGVWAHEHQRRR